MSSDQYFDELWRDALKKYFKSTHRTPIEQALFEQLKTPNEFENQFEQLKTPDDLQQQLETHHSKFREFRERHG
jgi:hypothetical protein